VYELTAVVLAAGSSSRMGGFKPLLDLGGRTLLAQAVRAFADAGVLDIVVVTGHRGDEVALAASRLGCRPAANPDFEDGMFSSVRTGAAAVAEGRGFFVLPVDCPLVRPETVGRLARTAGAAGAPHVVPAYAGRRGHPPVFGPGLRTDVLTAPPDGTLRDVLAGRPGLLVLEVDDPGVLHDADTPGDLEALRAAAALEELPSPERCRVLLEEQVAGAGLVAHAAAVATAATALALALNERQQYLCVPLVTAAALLHDVARAKPHHADAGADLLEELGYPRLAPLLRRHMRLGAPADVLDETQVVYLADKMVSGDRVVGLEERFSERLARMGHDAAASEAVRARRDEARLVLDRVDTVLGSSGAALAAAALRASAGG
jgi:molybdenum cofactor cytidylyltransferase